MYTTIVKDSSTMILLTACCILSTSLLPTIVRSACARFVFPTLPSSKTQYIFAVNTSIAFPVYINQSCGRLDNYTVRIYKSFTPACNVYFKFGKCQEPQQKRGCYCDHFENSFLFRKIMSKADEGEWTWTAIDDDLNKIAESKTTFQITDPGALYRVTHGNKVTFTCTADPVEVHALNSLEVSQILNRSFAVGQKTHTLDITTSSDHGGTLSIKCKVDQGISFIQSIEIGKGQQTSQTKTLLASIGPNNQIVKHGTQNNFGIDGHLDPSASTTAFLRLRIHYMDCSYSGVFYCSVNAGVVHNVERLANICGNIAKLSIEKPDSDPTNAIFTCVINPHVTDKVNVSYMALYRTLARNNERESIAYANVSENDGKVQRFPAFIPNGVYVSGQLNISHPKDSKVQVSLKPGTCDDAGIYACQVVYKERNSTREQFSLTQAVLSNPCTSTRVGIVIQRYQTSDPSSFRVTCSFNSQGQDNYNRHRYNERIYMKVVNLELSLLPHTPNGHEQRSQIVYWDTFSQNQQLVVTPDYRQRGFSTGGTPSSGSLEFYTGPAGGLCRDAGVYRCKCVYVSSDATDFSPVFDIAEERLPVCKPGAVIRIINETIQDTFTCTVDPKEVRRLVSLEISQILERSLKVIAAINVHLNNAQPISLYRNVTVSGEIHPLNPSSSYLSITLSTQDDGSSQNMIVPTRCKAVIIGFKDQTVIESFADGMMKSV